MSDFAEGKAYVVQNVTYGELRPLTPADGDDYTYTPRPQRAPMIPPQWVPIGQYHAMIAEVQRLTLRVAELEKTLDAWRGD